MKKAFPLLLISSMFLIFSGCPEEEPEPPMEPEDIYEGCCSTDPVTAQVGQGNLYIPNVFTPNSDGINDIFPVNYDSNIVSIADFQILNREDSVIFQLATQNPNAIVWDGNMENGEGYNGLFTYRMNVADQNGTQMVVTGKSCAFRCDTTSTVIEEHSACRFPDQHDGHGGVNVSINSLSNECL